MTVLIVDSLICLAQVYKPVVRAIAVDVINDIWCISMRVNPHKSMRSISLAIHVDSYIPKRIDATSHGASLVSFFAYCPDKVTRFFVVVE